MPDQSNQAQSIPAKPVNPPMQNIPATQAQVVPPNPDAIFPWDQSIENNRHNVRALCDLEGLPLAQTVRVVMPDGQIMMVSPKEIVAACIRVESNFQNYYIGTQNPVIHKNFAMNANGVRYLSSTDYGIVQCNDYWHIGQGKDFPSVEYVLANPEACIRWMIRYYKTNGNLNAWCSYTSGAYREYLGKV